MLFFYLRTGGGSHRLKRTPDVPIAGRSAPRAGRPLEGLVLGLREGGDGVLVDGLGPEEHLEDVAAAGGPVHAVAGVP